MRVGIIGAGQLGRMLALAGYPLGQDFHFLASAPTDPACGLGDFITGDLSDPEKLVALADQVDRVTFEIENISVEAAELIADKLAPGTKALAATQDRLAEKELFGKLAIPCADFLSVTSPDDLKAALHDGKFPAVLKTRRLGYDGRGQRVVTNAEQLPDAWSELSNQPSILESFVNFDREVSMIGVRDGTGKTVFYPLMENLHEQGILRLTRAPYEDAELTEIARGYLSSLMVELNYIGTLTVEFFHLGNGLVANEIAPRVHNSGHWTIEGAQTSQFENHLRAITGLPLGSTNPIGHAAMINLLGDIPDRRELLAVPGLHFHDYGKSPRPQRKLGHCTLVDSSASRLTEHVHHVQSLLPEAGA